MRRTLALVLAFTLALLLPAVHVASAAPTGASVVEFTHGRILHWVGPDANTTAARVDVNETSYLWLELVPSVNATVEVEFFIEYTKEGSAGIDGAAEEPVVIRSENGSLVPPTSVRIDLPRGGADQNVTYRALGTVRVTENGSTFSPAGVVATGTFVLVGQTEVPVVPAPGIPRGAYIAGALVLLGVLVGGIVVGRQRAQRRAMNEGPKRSQVMREMELEQKLEKAKDPEQVQEIKAEIRQQEQVREKRRELQILEAKRADVLKTLDLLKKRHESGGLTKLQYDNMVAKKQGDLQKIEADIAQMEAEDAGGAAAS